MFIRGSFYSTPLPILLNVSAFLPLLASFNHGDYTKGALHLLGLGLAWLSAGALVLIATIFLCVPRQRRRVGPLCVAVWILTAVCAIFQAKGPWQIDSNDIIVTGLPGAAAVVVYAVGWLLSRRDKGASS